MMYNNNEERNWQSSKKNGSTVPLIIDYSVIPEDCVKITDSDIDCILNCYKEALRLLSE